MRARVLLLTVAAVGPGGCGGAQRGTAEVARAAGEVIAAGESGARADGAAALYLELAERELAEARLKLRVGDGEGARVWANRAGADAGLSRSMAVEAATRGAALRSEDDAEAISRELDRGGGGR
jgi:hypothetical protein